MKRQTSAVLQVFLHRRKTATFGKIGAVTIFRDIHGVSCPKIVPESLQKHFHLKREKWKFEHLATRAEKSDARHWSDKGNDQGFELDEADDRTAQCNYSVSHSEICCSLL